MRGKITNTNTVSVKFDSVSSAVKIIGYDANRQTVSETYAEIQDSTATDATDPDKRLESGTYVKTFSLAIISRRPPAILVANGLSEWDIYRTTDQRDRGV
jgi:hypothetical protein